MGVWDYLIELFTIVGGVTVGVVVATYIVHGIEAWREKHVRRKLK